MNVQHVKIGLDKCKHIPLPSPCLGDFDPCTWQAVGSASVAATVDAQAVLKGGYLRASASCVEGRVLTCFSKLL